jgi:sugar phosphate isomerase/epimerase
LRRFVGDPRRRNDILKEETMGLKERIGVDLGQRLSLEEGIEWAARNDVKYIDAQIDVAPNAMERFDDATCAKVREACAGHGIHLGLHTLSAVNIAELSPYLREATDAYLRAYMDLSKKVGAEWIVVHAGFHFTADTKLRMEAALDRLKRAAEYAEKVDALLLLENLNWEPDLAEVHYLAHNLEECLYFFDRIDSLRLRWSFTVNHAHIVPEGIDGFIDGMDMSRCNEVRVADNNGEYEIHMKPGEGTIDFGRMFKRIEASGFTGHYINGFGTLDDMLAGRDYLVERAREAGVVVD